MGTARDRETQGVHEGPPLRAVEGDFPLLCPLFTVFPTCAAFDVFSGPSVSVGGSRGVVAWGTEWGDHTNRYFMEHLLSAFSVSSCGGGGGTKKLWDFSTHLVNLYLHFVPVLFLSNEC